MAIIRDNSKHYTYPPELDKFRKLIFCPLDFPEPPEVDEEQLFKWIKMRADKDAGKLAASWAQYCTQVYLVQQVLLI